VVQTIHNSSTGARFLQHAVTTHQLGFVDGHPPRGMCLRRECGHQGWGRAGRGRRCGLCPRLSPIRPPPESKCGEHRIGEWDPSTLTIRMQQLREEPAIHTYGFDTTLSNGSWGVISATAMGSQHNTTAGHLHLLIDHTQREADCTTGRPPLVGQSWSTVSRAQHRCIVELDHICPLIDAGTCKATLAFRGDEHQSDQLGGSAFVRRCSPPRAMRSRREWKSGLRERDHADESGRRKK